MDIERWAFPSYHFPFARSERVVRGRVVIANPKGEAIQTRNVPAGLLPRS